MTRMREDDLDRLLATAAARPPEASARLLDRVLADALALQRQPGAAARPARQGVFARLAAAFGGAPMLAGVCSAALAGVALGYLNPATLDLLTGAEVETLDLFPATDFLTTEG
jgi:hypothetical protein